MKSALAVNPQNAALPPLRIDVPTSGVRYSFSKIYANRSDDAAEFKAWKERTAAYLTRRNYDKIVENYCRALEKHSDFVRRYSFLYLPPQPQ